MINYKAREGLCSDKLIRKDHFIIKEIWNKPSLRQGPKIIIFVLISTIALQNRPSQLDEHMDRMFCLKRTNFATN